MFLDLLNNNINYLEDEFGSEENNNTCMDQIPSQSSTRIQAKSTLEMTA